MIRPGRSWWRVSWAPLLSLAVPGCLSVGPDHVAPDVAAPDGYGFELARGLEAGPADVARWWVRFDDPVLNELVDAAVRGNLDLRVAWQRVAEAGALRGIAAGERFPRVDLDASYERSRLSSNTDTPLFPGFPDTQDDHRLVLGASWELDVWGRVRRLVEAADADLDAEVEALRDVRVSLVAEVVGRYVDVREAQRQIEIAHKNLDIQESTLRLVRARSAAGLVDDLEVDQARANVARTRAAIPPLRIREREAANQLAVLLGRRPGELDERLGGPGAIPVPPSSIAVGVPADLLRRRPDLRRAMLEVAASSARIGAAKAELYPRVELLGSIGRRSGDLGALFDSGSEIYSFGPTISWPVFAGGALRARVDAESARLEQARLRYEATALGAWREASDASYAFLREHDRRDSLTDAKAHAGEAVRKSEALYREGLVDFQNVLDNQRTLFLVEESFAAAEAEIARRVVALYRALGGGFEPEETATAASDASRG